MNNSLEVFDYNGAKVRTIQYNGEKWLIAKDVCNILGLKDVTSSLRLLDDDEKMTLQNQRSHSGQRGGAQFINIINEPGLYRLTFRSNRPEAKKFTRWVTHEVLQDVNKHGMYLSDKLMEQLINKPVVFREVCANYIESKLVLRDYPLLAG